MKLARLYSLVSFVVSCMAVHVYGLETEVQVAAAGVAQQNFFNAQGTFVSFEQDSFSVLGLPHVDPEGGLRLEELDLKAAKGPGSAVAHIRAVAEAGRIGAGIIIGATGSFGTPIRSVSEGVGGVNVARARASFKETWQVPPVPGIPVGTSIRINSLLFLNSEGEVGVAATGGSSAGSVSIQLKAANGAVGGLPVPPLASHQCPDLNCWGFAAVNTHPASPLDVSFEPPGAIAVRAFGVVGGSLTIGYEITVSGIAGSGDGAVAVGGDFSRSLKWGGVVSITNNANGQLLEGLRIESESGFDYMRSFDEQQVPEPSSVLLLAAALYAWPVRARPRRSQL